MPEEASSELLRRPRTGISAKSLVTHVKDGNLLMQLVLKPELRTRYEFPYMRDMPAYLLQPARTYTGTLIYGYSFKTLHGQGSSDIRSTSDQNSWANMYMTPYHAAEIVDSNLDLVRPSEWTTVCSNNPLMVRLLKNFFLLEYHWGSFFQKDYFLEDMVSRTTSLLLSFIGQCCAGMGFCSSKCTCPVPISD